MFKALVVEGCMGVEDLLRMSGKYYNVLGMYEYGGIAYYTLDVTKEKFEFGKALGVPSGFVAELICDGEINNLNAEEVKLVMGSNEEYEDEYGDEYGDEYEDEYEDEIEEKHMNVHRDVAVGGFKPCFIDGIDNYPESIAAGKKCVCGNDIDFIVFLNGIPLMMCAVCVSHIGKEVISALL
jgi:hypothetical protein